MPPSKVVHNPRYLLQVDLQYPHLGTRTTWVRRERKTGCCPPMLSHPVFCFGFSGGFRFPSPKRTTCLPQQWTTCLPPNPPRRTTCLRPPKVFSGPQLDNMPPSDNIPPAKPGPYLRVWPRYEKRHWCYYHVCCLMFPADSSAWHHVKPGHQFSIL